MNIEGFGDLPDGFSLADEPLRQFCLLGIELPRASEADPAVHDRVAAGLGAFPDEVSFKLGDARLEGAGNFRVVEAAFPSSVAQQFMRWVRLDGIGPARFATFEELGQPAVRLWPGSP